MNLLALCSAGALAGRRGRRPYTVCRLKPVLTLLTLLLAACASQKTPTAAP